MGNLPDAFFYVLVKIADLVLTVHLGDLNDSYDKYNFIMLYLIYQNTPWISIPFHANVVLKPRSIELY